MNARAHHLTQNGRPPAEALGTPVVSGKGAILTGDTTKNTLMLVRVQADGTARRGRGLVCFLSDLVQRVETPIPVVAECERCGRFFNVRVDLSDANAPLVRSLPGNCSCGEPLDTPAMIRDLVGTARYYAETATPMGIA